MRRSTGFVCALGFAVAAGLGPRAEHLEAQQRSMRSGGAGPVDVHGVEGLARGWREDARELVQQSCLTCHQEGGVGIEGIFPALVGNSVVLSSPEPLIRTVLQGRGVMPAFADLVDRELAYILSYIRSSWGNDAPLVSPSMVGRARRPEGSP